MKQNVTEIRRDKKPIVIVNNNTDVLHVMHQLCCQSMSWALKYEGYSLHDYEIDTDDYIIGSKYGVTTYTKKENEE